MSNKLNKINFVVSLSNGLLLPIKSVIEKNALDIFNTNPFTLPYSKINIDFNLKNFYTYNFNIFDKESEKISIKEFILNNYDDFNYVKSILKEFSFYKNHLVDSMFLFENYVKPIFYKTIKYIYSTCLTEENIKNFKQIHNTDDDFISAINITLQKLDHIKINSNFNNLYDEYILEVTY